VGSEMCIRDSGIHTAVSWEGSEWTVLTGAGRGVRRHVGALGVRADIWAKLILA